MFDPAEFFDPELMQAFADVEADIIPLGEHRLKIQKISAEQITRTDGGIQKLIVIRGYNADDSSPMVVRFGLLKKDGSPNPNALRDLGRGLIEAGIKRPLPEVIKMAEFPVVTLIVKEEAYTTAQGEEKTTIKKSITKCDNQTVTPQPAKPTLAPAPEPAQSAQEEVDDDAPF